MSAHLIPRHLFQGGSVSATPSINLSSGKKPIANGYFWAAQELCTMLRDNRGPVDTGVYPALFLLRHGLELVFKDLIEGFGVELDHERQPVHGHQLAALWARLEPPMQEWVDIIKYQLTEPPPDGFFAAMDVMPELVEVLHEIDPNGQHARYDRATNGERTLSRYPIINLEVLDGLVALVAEWAEYATCRRSDEVSFVEARRRERGGAG